ncbi:MAG: hypothetical protein Q8S31_00170 [Alphaproteobacteria bacterium]|nr:hypothetical protein [Alphaproteobacteria bacterium]
MKKTNTFLIIIFAMFSTPLFSEPNYPEITPNDADSKEITIAKCQKFSEEYKHFLQIRAAVKNLQNPDNVAMIKNYFPNHPDILNTKESGGMGADYYTDASGKIRDVGNKLVLIRGQCMAAEKKFNVKLVHDSKFEPSSSSSSSSSSAGTSHSSPRR